MRHLSLLLLLFYSLLLSAQNHALWNGYWSLLDSTAFLTTYSGHPGEDHHSRVNESPDSVQIKNETIYRVEHGKLYLLGYVKIKDSLTIEYQRRCCWDPEPYFRIDSMSHCYLQISKTVTTRDDGYDPRKTFDDPFPRGSHRPASVTREVQVVKFWRLGIF